MSAHTPGPWKAHKTNQARSGLPEFEIHWSDIGECVAEIVHGEANASLIAAAPDLLAALIGLDEAFCSINEFSTKEERHDARLKLIAARAAVVKATQP